MFAAFLWKYPYQSRVMLFAVPPLALLVAEGFACFTTWSLASRSAPTSPLRLAAMRTATAIAFVLVLLPLGLSAIHVVKPWSRLVFPWPEPAATSPQTAQN